MDSDSILAFDYSRRFGIEAELNSTDGRDFKNHPLLKGEFPKGIEYIADLVRNQTGHPIEILSYKLGQNHNYSLDNIWILKPDSSCGMEACSPVSKGWPGLKSICEVIDVFGKGPLIQADERCSLHVHSEIADLNKEEIANILRYWIKSEAVFLDSVPGRRKRNCYCQCIGMSNAVQHNSELDADHLIMMLGSSKYYTANVYHYRTKNRKTMEFRIGENSASKNPFLVKNWVRLVIHFIEMARQMPVPENYQPGNPWTGFCWLDPMDVMRLLKFNDPGVKLSPGLEQTRNWFLARLYYNVTCPESAGMMWSEEIRKIAKREIYQIIKDLDLTQDILQDMLLPSNPDLIYSNEFRN